MSSYITERVCSLYSYLGSQAAINIEIDKVIDQLIVTEYKGLPGLSGGRGNIKLYNQLNHTREVPGEGGESKQCNRKSN